MSTLQEYVPAVGLFLLPYIGGTVFGGLITGGETRGRWFRSLKSPHLKPPDWIFPPVWTAIYACMGVSSYLVYREGGLAAQGLPLALYGSQLLLNWAWSPIFFYFHRIDLVRAFLLGREFLERGSIWCVCVCVCMVLRATAGDLLMWGCQCQVM